MSKSQRESTKGYMSDLECATVIRLPTATESLPPRHRSTASQVIETQLRQPSQFSHCFHPAPCGKASSFPDPRRIQSHRRVLREIRVHLKDASLNIAEIHSSIVFDSYKRDHLIQTCSHTWTYHPSHADYERRGM